MDQILKPVWKYAWYRCWFSQYHLTGIDEKYNRFLFRISEGVKLLRNFGPQETIIWRSDIEARRRNKTQLDEDVKVWSLETIAWVRHCIKLNLTKMSNFLVARDDYLGQRLHKTQLDEDVKLFGCWRRLLGSAGNFSSLTNREKVGLAHC